MPTLAYWPGAAVPVAMQVTVSPAWMLVDGQLTVTCLSSVTVRLVSGTLPVFVTRYVQVTGSRSGIDGPGARSASAPLLSFGRSIAGLGWITL